MSIRQFIDLIANIFPVIVEFFTNIFGKTEENADA